MVSGGLFYRLGYNELWQKLGREIEGRKTGQVAAAFEKHIGKNGIGVEFIETERKIQIHHRGEINKNQQQGFRSHRHWFLTKFRPCSVTSELTVLDKLLNLSETLKLEV